MTEKNASPSSQTSRASVELHSACNRKIELEFKITVELSGSTIVFVSPKAVVYAISAGGERQKNVLTTNRNTHAAAPYHNTRLERDGAGGPADACLPLILFQR